jgi:Fe2+ or Zn2+ uptake regulation protein
MLRGELDPGGKLPFSSAMRFDANMTAHANLVCHTCGRIEDVEFVPEHLDTTPACRRGRPRALSATR